MVQYIPACIPTMIGEIMDKQYFFVVTLRYQTPDGFIEHSQEGKVGAKPGTTRLEVAHELFGLTDYAARNLYPTIGGSEATISFFYLEPDELG